MEVFFFKYRVLLFILSIIALADFFYESYRAVECLYLHKTGQGFGILIDAFIVLGSVVYILLNIRKANKKLKEESTINIK